MNNKNRIKKHFLSLIIISIFLGTTLVSTNVSATTYDVDIAVTGFMYGLSGTYVVAWETGEGTNQYVTYNYGDFDAAVACWIANPVVSHSYVGPSGHIRMKILVNDVIRFSGRVIISGESSSGDNYFPTTAGQFSTIGSISLYTESLYKVGSYTVVLEVAVNSVAAGGNWF